MRMIAKFEKKDAACYVSHLDLLRSIQRAIRRSGLPVKYSKGFNPHQNIAFASAMSVGMSSEGECIDVSLESDVSETEFFEALKDQMPPGLKLLEAHSVEDRYPALMSITAFADYIITIKLKKACTDEEIREKLKKSFEKPLLAMKKGKAGLKEVDLLQWIESWDCLVTQDMPGEDHAEAILSFRLVHAPTGALNPELLMNTLIDLWGADYVACSPRILRRAIWSKNDSGIVPLWGLR